jgi:hypothetical protein
MFISFAIDNESHRNTHSFISKEDILNVSITRARVKQYIMLSIDKNNISKDSLLRRYINYIEEFDFRKTQNINKEIEIHDEFMNEVTGKLKTLGATIYPAYEIAGLTIDIVITIKNKNWGIDLIGCPGIFKDAFPMERYRMYERAELPIIPLEYSQWLLNREVCFEKIRELIGS